jgi:SPP1 family predicted phage head-tail adaptor
MIGQLKYRAKLDKMKKVDNGRGGWTETPQSLGEIWVAQYRLTERQAVQFRQLDIEAENKFIARYNPEINEDTTLTVNGKKHRVLMRELPIDRTDYMEIYTKEVK